MDRGGCVVPFVLVVRRRGLATCQIAGSARGRETSLRYLDERTKRPDIVLGIRRTKKQVQRETNEEREEK